MRLNARVVFFVTTWNFGGEKIRIFRYANAFTYMYECEWHSLNVLRI